MLRLSAMIPRIPLARALTASALCFAARGLATGYAGKHEPHGPYEDSFETAMAPLFDFNGVQTSKAQTRMPKKKSIGRAKRSQPAQGRNRNLDSFQKKAKAKVKQHAKVKTVAKKSASHHKNVSHHKKSSDLSAKKGLQVEGAKVLTDQYTEPELQQQEPNALGAQQKQGGKLEEPQKKRMEESKTAPQGPEDVERKRQEDLKIKQKEDADRKKPLKDYKADKQGKKDKQKFVNIAGQEQVSANPLQQDPSVKQVEEAADTLRMIHDKQTSTMGSGKVDDPGLNPTPNIVGPSGQPIFQEGRPMSRESVTA